MLDELKFGKQPVITVAPRAHCVSPPNNKIPIMSIVTAALPVRERQTNLLTASPPPVVFCTIALWFLNKAFPQ
jgi:hypothetical protein